LVTNNFRPLLLQLAKFYHSPNRFISSDWRVETERGLVNNNFRPLLLPLAKFYHSPNRFISLEWRVEIFAKNTSSSTLRINNVDVALGVGTWLIKAVKPMSLMILPRKDVCTIFFLPALLQVHLSKLVFLYFFCLITPRAALVCA